MDNKPLSLNEKNHLKSLGITQSTLNRKYTNARLRAETRKEGILPIYAFYREYLRQLEEMAKTLNTTPSTLLPLVDTHSIDGYKEFKLLMRAEHKMLHSEKKHQHAKEVLAKGRMTCRHCGEEKPLTAFVKAPSTFIGYVTTCKVCDKNIRRAKREVA